MSTNDPSVGTPPIGMRQVPDDLQRHRGTLVQALSDWIAIPSISGDLRHAGAVTASARWLVSKLTAWGCPHAEVWETEGRPAVFAHWPARDQHAPTVLVYGHHDVQPAEHADGWRTPPFEPSFDGRVITGRGSIDDKGQVLMHALAAMVAVGTEEGLPVSVKLLIEGEEEVGSPNFRQLLQEGAKMLACDVIVVADSGMSSETAPSTTVGARGTVGLEITVRGIDSPLHSGDFGGAIRNPLTELARLLGRLHDEDGRVMIPHFYDAVVPPTATQRESAARQARSEPSSVPVGAVTHGEQGFTDLERVWFRPTAEVNAIWGGHTGPGISMTIPSEAHARVSFRLVLAQNPAYVVEQATSWIRDSLPTGLRVDVTAHQQLPPNQVDEAHPAVRAVLAALESSFGHEAHCVYEGGSGPDSFLSSELRAPVVSLGVALPQDGWHSTNESVDVDRLLTGAEATIGLWRRLAAVGPGGGPPTG
jgi:acetylornithine deacetylase/succinyl-diaminopimelate desuccinylase-like protein